MSLPASHSVTLPSINLEPWGQAQVYPSGLRRQRWLQTFLQRLGTGKQKRTVVSFRGGNEYPNQGHAHPLSCGQVTSEPRQHTNTFKPRATWKLTLIYATFPCHPTKVPQSLPVLSIPLLYPSHFLLASFISPIALAGLEDRCLSGLLHELKNQSALSNLRYF